MAVELNLTPAAIAAAEYQTVRTPALGGEIEVKLSTGASYLLGTALLTADGTLEYTYVSVPTANPGPIVAVAIGAGVQQAAADTITYGGLTGSFTPNGWSSNRTFNFPVSRGVELTGTYSAPTSSSVPTLSLGGSNGMLRGSRFALYQMPLLASFVAAGCTSDRNVTMPVRGTKNIPCGMEEAEWTTPGSTKAGELSITGLNQGYDDGLLRFAGVKCQAMLYRLRESRLITERTICLDWTPTCRTPYPSGESEATVELSGSFNKAIVLVAS